MPTPPATGPSYALASGAGGNQIGDGLISEPRFQRQGAATAYTTTATLTTADLGGGLITTDATGGAYNMTLPLAADMDTAFPNAGVNSALKFTVVSIGATNSTTILTNTGWTLVGSMAVVTLTSVTFTARKTATGAWTLYRGG